jgi:mRNA-degrading endonuclease RelE of RelBE toxin-antitoxin system
MDWIAPSFYRIRASPAAAAKLVKLQLEMQDRLRTMLEEITELTNISPPRPDNSWLSATHPALLTLQIGRVCVRYSISEESRTLTIEHVIFLDDEEPLGQTG